MKSRRKENEFLLKITLHTIIRIEEWTKDEFHKKNRKVQENVSEREMSKKREKQREQHKCIT